MPSANTRQRQEVKTSSSDSFVSYLFRNRAVQIAAAMVAGAAVTVLPTMLGYELGFEDAEELTLPSALVGGILLGYLATRLTGDHDYRAVRQLGVLWLILVALGGYQVVVGLGFSALFLGGLLLYAVIGIALLYGGAWLALRHRSR